MSFSTNFYVKNVKCLLSVFFSLSCFACKNNKSITDFDRRNQFVTILDKNVFAQHGTARTLEISARK